MFKGIAMEEQFLLFHDDQLLPLGNNDGEHPDAYLAEQIAFTLLYHYFSQFDDDSLAQVKAGEICECVSRCLALSSDGFELEEEELARAVRGVIRNHAVATFDSYCNQVLYIRSLHHELGQRRALAVQQRP